VEFDFGAPAEEGSQVGLGVLAGEPFEAGQVGGQGQSQVDIVMIIELAGSGRSGGGSHALQSGHHQALIQLPAGRTERHHHGPGPAIGVDPEFLSTAAGSVISRSMLLPVPP
jgi:hypothetical protein